jgi:hypothetical protein
MNTALHILLIGLSFFLLLKSIKTYIRFKQNVKAMICLTRMQVINFLKVTILFSLLYAIGEFFAMFHNINFNSANLLEYFNEVLIISALIYLIYKFKKR